MQANDTNSSRQPLRVRTLSRKAKNGLIVSLVVTALLFSTCNIATAACAKELTSTEHVAFVPLPTACRSMGPIKLGITKRSLLAIMGAPAETFGEHFTGDTVYVYVLPRALEAQLREYPRTEKWFYAHELTVTVNIRDNRVRAISVLGVRMEATAFGVGGILIGERINALLREVKTPPDWNKTHDNIIFAPYPIDIGATDGLGRITGIGIADSLKEPIAPAGIGFSFSFAPSSTLINGYSIFSRTTSPAI